MKKHNIFDSDHNMGVDKGVLRGTIAPPNFMGKLTIASLLEHCTSSSTLVKESSGSIHKPNNTK